MCDISVGEGGICVVCVWRDVRFPHLSFGTNIFGLFTFRNTCNNCSDRVLTPITPTYKC